MTQGSLPWGGVSIGDAAGGLFPAPYSDDEWSDVWRKLFIGDRAAEGVIAGYSNELEVTTPGGLNYQVDTGAALVDGKFYESNAVESYTFAGAAGEFERIVLRKDWAAQTVRQVVLGPAGGVPALTQVDGTTWEIPLATIQENAGALEITDERELICLFKTLRAGMKLGQATCGYNHTTAAKIGYLSSYPWVGGLPPTDDCIAYASMMIPDDYKASGKVYAVVVAYNDGDVYVEAAVKGGACGESHALHESYLSWHVETLEGSMIDYNCICEMDVSAWAQPGDFLDCSIYRKGSSPADTNPGPISLVGFLLLYDAER